MIKKVLVCVISVFIILTNFSVSESNAVIFHPDKNDIAEAIKYGKDNKRTNLTTFSRKWTVRLGKEVGWATLFTGFHNVAFKARKSHIEHKELTSNQINEAVDIGKELTFTVSILGNGADFAREYQAMLKLDNSFIAPTFDFIPEYAEASES